MNSKLKLCDFVLSETINASSCLFFYAAAWPLRVPGGIFVFQVVHLFVQELPQYNIITAISGEILDGLVSLALGYPMMMILGQIWVWNAIFMPPTCRVPEALCFWVVRPYGNLVTAISGEPLGRFFIMLVPRVPHTEKNNWLDFGSDLPEVKDQRSMKLVWKYNFYLVITIYGELGGFWSYLAQGYLMTRRCTH